MDESIDMKMRFPVMVPIVPMGDVFLFKDKERDSFGVPVFNFDEASD